jgi:hypothetical protein
MEAALNPPATSPAALKKPLLISAGLAGLLVIVGGYNDALMFAPIGLLALCWQVLCALGYTVRRQWLMLKLCGLRMLIWIAALAILTGVHNYYLKTTRQSAQDVVSALQGYRAREGHYPKTLEALAPRDIAVVPLWRMSPSRDYPFHYRPTGAPGTTDAWGVYQGQALNYTLRYFTGFRHQHIYDSATGQWTLTD